MDVRSILDGAGVEVAYLFGSRAVRKERPGSDADVAVLLSEPLDLLQRSGLANRLAEALEVPEVDVVILDEAPLELRGRVVQEGRVLFSANEPRRVEFEVRTRSEYFDFLPVLEEMTARYLGRVAERGFRG